LARKQIKGDRDLEKFIAKIADSFVKIELIKFFHHNPHFLGKIGDISLAIGRDPKKVSKGIDDLVLQGVIKKNGQKSAAIWSYAPEASMDKKITQFIKAYEGPDLRQWIVNQVIRGGK
jgi:hypothetical protein